MGSSLYPFLLAAAALAGCAASPPDPGPSNLENPLVHPSGDAGVATAGPDAASPSTDASDAQPSTIDAAAPPREDAAGMGGDAGAPVDASLVDAGNPYATPTVCTSGVMWTLGNVKSPEMNPGLACDTCHTLGGSASGYEFDVAGTVYPTAHEPDDCDGTSSASIVITDAKQAVHTLTVNSAGNFYNFDYVGVGAIPAPFTVKVVSGSASRPMLTPVTNGDCNSCHTEQGAESAPGRVMTP